MKKLFFSIAMVILLHAIALPLWASVELNMGLNAPNSGHVNQSFVLGWSVDNFGPDGTTFIHVTGHLHDLPVTVSDSNCNASDARGSGVWCDYVIPMNSGGSFSTTFNVQPLQTGTLVIDFTALADIDDSDLTNNTFIVQIPVDP